MPWKSVRSPGPQSHSTVRQRTGSRISRGTHPLRRGIQRGRQTVPTEVLVAGDHLRTQPIRRSHSQPAKPAGESAVQIRFETSSQFSETGSCSPSFARPPRWLCGLSTRHGLGRKSKRSHHCWGLLCRYRCRLLLADISKGVDRNFQLKQRLQL